MKRKLRHVPGSPVAGSPVPGSPVPSSPVPSSPVPSSPVPSSPVPSSPVGGHPPAAEQQGSLYSVQDDEPVKRRQGEETIYLNERDIFKIKTKVLKLMRSYNAAAAEISSDGQNYLKQELLQVSATGAGGFQEYFATNNLKPKFVSRDELLSSRLLEIGHPSELLFCTEIPDGFFSLRNAFSSSFCKGLALPDYVYEAFALSLLAAVEMLHRNGSTRHRFSPDTVLIGPNMRIKFLRLTSIEDILRNLEVNACFRAPPATASSAKKAGAIETHHGHPDGSKEDMYGVGALLFMCATGRAPLNLERSESGRPQVTEVPHVRARDLIRWLLHGKSGRRPEASKALRHPWLRRHQYRQLCGTTGAATFSNQFTPQQTPDEVDLLPGNPYGRLCQSRPGWAASSNDRASCNDHRASPNDHGASPNDRGASPYHRGANRAYVSDSDSDVSLDQVAASDRSPMRVFLSDEKDNIAASGKLPPSPTSPSPMQPLPPPLLPNWFGDASATSGGGSDGGDELSSDAEGSSTGSCGSSTRLVGATFGGDGGGGDSTGHSQKYTLIDAGLLPSASNGGSSPLPAESSSSSNDGPALPLSLRKYAKKWASARAAVATVVAPPPAPRIPELGIESAATAADTATAAAGEDRALPWISTAVAAARTMTRTTTAIPATIATAAAARFRSHWG